MQAAVPPPEVPETLKPEPAAAGAPALAEPPQLVRAFLAHPPVDFAVTEVCPGLPGFTARFDLLTTAEPGLRRFIERIPGYRWFRRLLQPRTLFIGTTVTEYAVLPRTADPEELARCIAARTRERAFTIVKDLPCAGTLVGAEAAAQADALAAALQRRGFVLLEGQALAHVPVDFADTAEFLARQPRSRRKDIRRKLKARDRVRVETRLTGDPWLTEPATFARICAMYDAVYAQSEIHFDRLTPEFFRTVLADPDNRGVLFLYYRDADLIGWNLCFPAGSAFVDKYIGFAYPAARELNLYFVSWIRNLEYACAHGFREYVAGWTDPAVKAHLGASFTMTRHAVYPRSALLRFALRHARKLFESDRAILAETHASDRP